jgi:hypothetical protein
MDLCLKFGALALAVSCSQAALLAQSTTLSCRPLAPGNNFIYPDERVVGNQAWKIVQKPTVPEKQAVLRATVTPPLMRNRLRHAANCPLPLGFGLVPMALLSGWLAWFCK